MSLLSVDIEQGGYWEGSSVLKDIQFSVEPGELVGLIGPNGAGKSSTIKGILGVLNNVKGNIDICDYAYVPERPIYYENLTLWEHIDFLFSTLDVEEQDFFARADELLERFQMKRVIHDYPHSFSKGMQQKGIIVLAFLKQPDLYIIDEPFMGLDPKATKRLLTMLEVEKSRGAGILMSTHALDTAEKICDRFIFIANGKLLITGSLSDIQEKSRLVDGSLLDCFDALTEEEDYVD